MRIPYVTDFPSEAAMDLVPLLRGKLPTDPATKLQMEDSACNMVRYGVYQLNQIGPAQPAASASEPPLTQEMVADILEAKAKGQPFAHAWGDGTWLKWIVNNLPTILQTIQTIGTVAGTVGS